MLQCLDKWRLKSMDLFSTILLLIAVSGCCFAENIDFERGVFFPSDDFKLPTSLCPSFTPLCSKFNAHSLGGCWCSCPTAFSFYEHVFKCVHSSEARRSAGCELRFTDEAADKSLPFFQSSSAEKLINVPANQNCSFYFGNQFHVNYLRCDGTWKSQSLAGIVEVTPGWSTSRLSIKLKSGSSLPQSMAGRTVRVAVQCGALNSHSPFKTTCVMFKIKGEISCSYPQSTPAPSQETATLPTPVTRKPTTTAAPTTKPATQSPAQTQDKIETSPISCQKSGEIQIENHMYLAKCFFFCCRECNKQFYKCVQTVQSGVCLRMAFDCGEKCARDSSLNITVS